MVSQSWDMYSFEQGSIALVAHGNSLLRVCFENTPDDVATSVRRFYPQAKKVSQSLTDEALQQLGEYFLATRHSFDLPLDYSSMSSFTREVHDALVNVPYGTLVSYAELAAAAGSPQAARAVGRVMSFNPFPLLAPCHRVVNAGGSIGQYSAARGSKTKSWLIEFERSHTSG